MAELQQDELQRLDRADETSASERLAESVLHSVEEMSVSGTSKPEETSAALSILGDFELCSSAPESTAKQAGDSRPAEKPAAPLVATDRATDSRVAGAGGTFWQRSADGWRLHGANGQATDNLGTVAREVTAVQGGVRVEFPNNNRMQLDTAGRITEASFSDNTRATITWQGDRVASANITFSDGRQLSLTQDGNGRWRNADGTPARDRNVTVDSQGGMVMIRDGNRESLRRMDGRIIDRPVESIRRADGTLATEIRRHGTVRAETNFYPDGERRQSVVVFENGQRSSQTNFRRDGSCSSIVSCRADGSRESETNYRPNEVRESRVEYGSDGTTVTGRTIYSAEGRLQTHRQFDLNGQITREQHATTSGGFDYIEFQNGRPHRIDRFDASGNITETGLVGKPLERFENLRPISKPADGKPPEKPSEGKPADKPLTLKPAEKTAESPLIKPLENKPVSKPAEERLSRDVADREVKPVDARPVVVEAKPVDKPILIRPGDKPVEAKPIATERRADGVLVEQWPGGIRREFSDRRANGTFETVRETRPDGTTTTTTTRSDGRVLREVSDRGNAHRVTDYHWRADNTCTQRTIGTFGTLRTEQTVEYRANGTPATSRDVAHWGAITTTQDRTYRANGTLESQTGGMSGAAGLEGFTTTFHYREDGSCSRQESHIRGVIQPEHTRRFPTAAERQAEADAAARRGLLSDVVDSNPNFGVPLHLRR